jgi:NADH dehydrogenase (ubiquinone) 1 alpha subcomplex subunit 2
MCQKSSSSQGVRDFVFSNYAEMKIANPLLPILIREASGAEAKLTARFDFGVEKSVSVQGDNPSQVMTKLQQLIAQGSSLPKSGE